MKFFVVILLLLVASNTGAATATNFCAPSATGNSSGDDFNNLAAFTGGGVRDEIYRLIDGSYGNITLGTAASGTTRIVVEKVTAADSGVAGYSSALHDGQAVFGSITFNDPYYTVDGKTRTETNNFAEPAGYGFRATSLNADSGNGDNADELIVRYVQVGGAWSTNPSDGTIETYSHCVRFVYDQVNVTFTRCYFHNGINLAMIHGSDGFIFEYCTFAYGWGKEAITAMNAGADNLVTRYCGFFNSTRKNAHDPSSGLTAEIGAFGPGLTQTGWEIYGNWFSSTVTDSARNQVIIVGGYDVTDTAVNCKVYNNTFANILDAGSGSAIILYSGSGNEARNNYFYNSAITGVTANATSHNITNASDLFVNYANLDLRLDAATTAGTTLTGDYASDPNGLTRGADGTFDVGAFEFNSGAGDTTDPTVTAFTIPSTASSLTVSISTFTATDDTAVTHYLLNEVASEPSGGDAGWAGAQTQYVFSTAGSKTLYAWAKDAAGNISTSLNDSVVITLPAGTANVTTLNAGTTYVGGQP